MEDFNFVGTSAFSGQACNLRHEDVGGDTLVQADRDGDGVTDFEIQLLGSHELTLENFVL
ncbi:hypothetical protein [Salipiger mucosus]|uniref:hypothetical protein n=1 Tax=Salipiger mucosus TaxID=263378 RepID=UPI0003762FB1|nr:hypothetical protein [Salipiger mucosus]